MSKLFALCALLSLSFATDAIITRITDGDTLHVSINGKEEKVRILYIDTPEKYSGAKLEKDEKKSGIFSKNEQALGKLSSSYATKFFHIGDKVNVTSNKKDQYGRMLGTVSKNGVDYSTQIIRDGYSCIYKKAKYPKDLDNVLQEAKESKKGLWSVDFEVMNRLCR